MNIFRSSVLISLLLAPYGVMAAGETINLGISPGLEHCDGQSCSYKVPEETNVSVKLVDNDYDEDCVEHLSGTWESTYRANNLEFAIAVTVTKATPICGDSTESSYSLVASIRSGGQETRAITSATNIGHVRAFTVMSPTIKKGRDLYKLQLDISPKEH